MEKLSTDQILALSVSASYNANLAKKYGINCAIILNKIAFLCQHSKREDGYCWATADDWYETTGLTEYQVNLAVKKLVKEGIILHKNDLIEGTTIRCRHFKFAPQTLETRTLETKGGNLRNLGGVTLETKVPYNNIINKNIDKINKNNVQEEISNDSMVVYESKKQLLKKEYPIEAQNLTKLLYQLILRNDPVMEKRLKKWEFWVDDIEKIHRLDGREWHEIEAVIRWCQENNFWKANILSGGKLRKQFPKLRLQAIAEKEKQNKFLMI